MKKAIDSRSLSLDDLIYHISSFEDQLTPSHLVINSMYFDDPDGVTAVLGYPNGMNTEVTFYNYDYLNEVFNHEN